MLRPCSPGGAPALIATVDTLAHLEFARVADPGYATLLRDLAAAMGGDDNMGEALSLAVVTGLFPDVTSELDAPAPTAVTGVAAAAAAATEGISPIAAQQLPSSFSLASPYSHANGVNGGSGFWMAWRDDDVFGTRLHLLLRLLPYAAPRIDRSVDRPLLLPGHQAAAAADTPDDYRQLSASSPLVMRALPAALRCMRHPRSAIVRAAHVAHVAVFRTHPALHAVSFPPYLDTALANFPGSTPAESFVAAVNAVATHGEPGSYLIVTAARRLVARAGELDREANTSLSSYISPALSGEAATAAAIAAAGSATLRRLVFNLMTLVDHHLVPELQAVAEAAVLSVGRSGVGSGGNIGDIGTGRMAAYEDLVAGVLSGGDYARKAASVEWALRLRSRI